MPALDFPYAILFLVGGLVTLVWGAHVMVRNAILLGVHYRLSSIVIGTTIIAFGTSAPEFVVSFVAGVRGNPGIALGNVLGSNVANLALVLGAAAVLAPFSVSRGVIRVEFVATVLITVLVAGLAWNGVLGRMEGGGLLGLFVVLFAVYFRKALADGKVPPVELPGATKEVQPDQHRFSGHGPGRHFALTGFGLAILVGGSEIAVHGAARVCELMEIPQAVIGATIIALGTSLPELATTLVAIRQGGGRELVLGNVLGSNIFNLLFVLGPTALVSPLTLDAIEREVMLPAMLAVTVLPFIVVLFAERLSRLVGVLLLAGYAAFLVLIAGGGG